jgi:hypothetical protein
VPRLVTSRSQYNPGVGVAHKPNDPSWFMRTLENSVNLKFAASIVYAVSR